MCNDYGVDIPFSLFVAAFSEIGLPLKIPEAIPNLQPRDEIWPTDRAPIFLARDGGAILEERRWGLGGRPGGPPVINLRAEGRDFRAGRCLVPASHFYEFTGAKSPKDRWKVTKTGEDWFCIAGILGRARVADGEVPAFSLLTVAPGPDILPLHDRQVAVLDRADWRAWLDPATPAARLLASRPAGALTVAAAPRAKVNQ